MEKEISEKESNKELACSFIINLSVFMLWTLLWGYFHDMRPFVILRNLLLDVFGAFSIWFSFWTSSHKGELFRWNEGQGGRYSFIVALCAGALSGMPYIPFLAVPAAVAAIILTVFSGGFCGLVSYLFMIMQYILLSGFKTEQVIVLVFSGMLGVVLFKSLNKEFRYAGVLFVYLVGDFICCSVFYVVTALNVDLGDSLMYVGIRLFSELVLILLLLKIVGKYCIYREGDLFKEINDSGCKLLTRLKSADEEIYIHAVHTAYLSEKISQKLEINTVLAKAGGYYHKIGILEGADTIENTLKVGRDNKFPKSLMALLAEYGNGAPKLSKEAAVVQLSDEVVSSISDRFLKNKSAILNYKKIIDDIIRKKMNSRNWNGCELTMRELYKIKEGFMEEKTYYDSLC